MRGDMRSNRELRTDGMIQRDSGSSSSSPHSSSSHDDDILEVSGPTGFMPKPIYNFSIPDMIKHEPRVERHEISDRLDDDLPLNRHRKRTHQSRYSRDLTHSCDENETPLSLRSKRRRRSLAAAENIIDDDGDDDCHYPPPFIDLTEVDSHDEYQSAHSDSEVPDIPHAETRPLHHNSSASLFSEVLSDLHHFRQQLQDSQNARLLLRSSSLHLQRLRNRRYPQRPIITDGPLVTEDMLHQSPEPVNVSTPDTTTADDSVMVVNEVRGNQHSRFDDDRAIAMQMAHDPTFSPPYLTPPNLQRMHHHRHLFSRYAGNDESVHQFQERIRTTRQHNRETLEQARRISQEAHERLVRIHESINNLRQGRSSAEHQTNASENNNSEPEIRSRETHDTSNDDVEIIHEWNPRNVDYLQPPINVLSPLPASFHMHSINGRQMPLHDFLRPLMSSWSPGPPPRLHHLHHIQEDYEALLNLAERIGPAKPRGLNKTEIDLIPSFRYSTLTAKETNRKCVICMGEYANREKLRRLPCKHDFHAKCIDKWLRSNKTCPICRDELNATA